MDVTVACTPSAGTTSTSGLTPGAGAAGVDGASDGLADDVGEEVPDGPATRIAGGGGAACAPVTGEGDDASRPPPARNSPPTTSADAAAPSRSVVRRRLRGSATEAVPPQPGSRPTDQDHQQAEEHLDGAGSDGCGALDARVDRRRDLLRLRSRGGRAASALVGAGTRVVASAGGLRPQHLGRLRVVGLLRLLRR